MIEVQSHNSHTDTHTFESCSQECEYAREGSK